LKRVNNPFFIQFTITTRMSLTPYTSADLIREREAFETAKAREYVSNAVEKIYYAVRKHAVETNVTSYVHIIPGGMFNNVQSVAEAIRDELFTLFPDFGVHIQVVNYTYDRGRNVVVGWRSVP